MATVSKPKSDSPAHGIFESISNAVSSIIGGHAAPAHATVTINLLPKAVYTEFRKLETLPASLTSLAKLKHIEIIDDAPGVSFSFHAKYEGVPVQLAAMFDRAPGRDATELHVEVVLGGKARVPAPILRRFAQEKLKADLRRFKQLVETGEILVPNTKVRGGAA